MAIPDAGGAHEGLPNAPLIHAPSAHLLLQGNVYITFASPRTTTASHSSKCRGRLNSTPSSKGPRREARCSSTERGEVRRRLIAVEIALATHPAARRPNSSRLTVSSTASRAAIRAQMAGRGPTSRHDDEDDEAIFGNVEHDIAAGGKNRTRMSRREQFAIASMRSDFHDFAYRRSRRL